ncbi:hypothetical protein DXG03_006392, partial [Asterophora parasitica]
MTYVDNIAASSIYDLNGHRTFTFAGTDTTSNALARTLYLLSSHPKVQSMLRDEIREARESGNGLGELDYDELNALPFLDAVCRETLR